MKTTCIYIYISLSCESYQYVRIMQIAMLYRIRQKSSDYLSLVRDRKDIIVIIILLSHGIYMKDNWRPIRMVLWIQSWLGIRARLGLHLFRLCRLKTVHCCGWQLGHRLIILSTYLLMGAGRLVTLLSWVSVLSGPTDWRRGRWRSKHHAETGS